MVASASRVWSSGSMDTPAKTPICFKYLRTSRNDVRSLVSSWITAARTINLLCKLLLSGSTVSYVVVDQSVPRTQENSNRTSKNKLLCSMERLCSVLIQLSIWELPSIRSFQTRNSSFVVQDCFHDKTFRAMEGVSEPPQTSAMSSSKPWGKEKGFTVQSHTSFSASVTIISSKVASMLVLLSCPVLCGRSSDSMDLEKRV
mmetsp:Transcript_25156/g.30927  ORF Transcript_25156/g.30927 Transcript_25156/m.30927 type:complete len:201 (+) Transcript_25156:216-818(+)